MVKKDNALIKRKNLILKLRGGGIQRVSPDAILVLEKYFDDKLREMIEGLKEEVFVKGRKTLKKEDVESVLKNVDLKEEIFEI